MSELIAKYTVFVYDDGNILTKREPIGSETKDKRDDGEETIVSLKLVSGRIRQILQTMRFFVEIYDERGMEPVQVKTSVREAIKKTAEACRISTQSVVDKLSRQLGMEIADFDGYMEELLEFLKTGDKESDSYRELEKFKEKLKEKASTRASLEDVEIINRFFANPRIEFDY